jgi:hypothetical protein
MRPTPHGSARLCLFITTKHKRGPKQQVYQVRPVELDLGAAVVQAWQLTRAGKGKREPEVVTYTVHQDQHGPHCDCADWVYNRQFSPRGCKHVESLRAVGLLPALEAV